MANDDISSTVYGIFLMSVSVILGILSIYYTYQFRKYKKYRFIEIRKPNLISLYCICGSIPSLLIISPLKTYIDVYYYQNIEISINTFYLWWLTTFAHSLCISFMFIYICARCWLLYYDHSFELSAINQSWQGTINKYDNFWLKNRKTWGDFGFVIFVAINISTIILILYSIISIWVFKYTQMEYLIIVSFIVAIICCLFVIIIIIKGINDDLFGNKDDKDKFRIFEEMKKLTYCMIIIIFIYILEIIIFANSSSLSPWKRYILLLEESGQVFYAFITTYIQNKWVIKQFKSHYKYHNYHKSITKNLMNKKMKKDKEIKQQEQRTSFDQIKKQIELQMIDVIKNEEGFEMFLRHCQSEFCVEGLLYLVEVTWYKAKIYPSIMPSLQYSQTQTITTTGTITATQTTESSTGNVARTLLTSRSSTTESVITKLPALSQFRKDSDTQPFDYHDIEQFEGNNILSQNWTIIAKQFVNDKRKSKDQSKNKSSIIDAKSLQFPIIEENQSEKAIEDGNNNEYELKFNPDIIDSDDDKEQHDELSSDNNNDKDVSISWIYKCAQYLFMKYIDVESEFSINVSHKTREDLLLFFMKDQKGAFEYILDKYNIETSIESDHAIFIITKYLYNIFNKSFGEIWELLSGDSFVRFMQTKEYQFLLKKHQQKG